MATGIQSQREIESAQAFLAGIDSDTETSPIHNWWKKLGKKVKDPGYALGYVAARSHNKKMRELAALMLFNCSANTDSEYAETFVERTMIRAADAMTSAMKDRTLADSEKVTVLPLLEAIGHPVSQEEAMLYFDDVATAIKNYVTESVEQLSDSAESLYDQMNSFDLFPKDEFNPFNMMMPPAGGKSAPPVRGPFSADEDDEEDFDEDDENPVFKAYEFSRLVADKNTALATGMICTATALGFSGGFCTPEIDWPGALHQAISLNPERAHWFLREMGNLPGLGLLGGQARDMAAGLRQNGVKATPPDAYVFQQGLTTICDGAGSRSLMICARTGEGAVDSLMLLVNDTTGIKDLWCTFDDADFADDVRDSMGGSGTVCNLEWARRIFAGALHTHAATGKPAPAEILIYRHILGPGEILPEAYQPDLNVYLAETVVRNAKMVSESGKLFDEQAYNTFFYAEDPAYEFLKKTKKPRGNKIDAEMLATYARECAALGKERLLSRMALNLELEGMAGRAKDPVNQVALRTWIAIAEDVVPFEEIPYVQKLCKHSIKFVRENLDMGIESNKDYLQQQAMLSALGGMMGGA